MADLSKKICRGIHQVGCKISHMKVIGITGGFGAGKTITSAMFARLGGMVISADEVTRILYRPGTRVYWLIVKKFGRDILNKNRTINRRKIASIVFSNKKTLKSLNSITHRYILKSIKEELNAIKNRNARAIVFVDAPLLIESNFFRKVNYIVVVNASKKVQIDRLIRKGFSKDFIACVSKNQLPFKDKLRVADYVIDNNGSRKRTFNQVKKIWKEIISGG